MRDGRADLQAGRVTDRTGRIVRGKQHAEPVECLGQPHDLGQAADVFYVRHHRVIRAGLQERLEPRLSYTLFASRQPHAARIRQAAQPTQRRQHLLRLGQGTFDPGTATARPRRG